MKSCTCFYRVTVILITTGMLVTILQSVANAGQSTELLFFDDMESGTSNWIAENPWGLVTNDYVSPNHSWHDSPGGNYLNDEDTSLVLLHELNFSGYENVNLQFETKHFFESCCDRGYVEVSNDGGNNWSLIGTLTATQSIWVTKTYNLDQYIGQNIRIRFRFISDYSVTYDGWYIDDVQISGDRTFGLGVSPSSDFLSAGVEGGPFDPFKKLYILTNDANEPLDWTAEASQPWLTIVPVAGTLAAGASANMEVLINDFANSLLPGSYDDLVIFSDTTSDEIQSRQVKLDVMAVPGEMEIIDSIPGPNMLFGDVFIGLTETETVTIKNVDTAHSLLISQIGRAVNFEGFFEDFSETTLDPNKWAIIAGVPTIDGVGLNEPSEPYSLRLNGDPDGLEGIESVPMDFSILSELVLVYWYEQTGGGESPDGGEDLVVEYWNGSSWVELDRQFGEGPDMNVYQQRVIALPPSAMHSEFKLRIGSTATVGNYDDWFVDDVAIVHIDQIGTVVDANNQEILSTIKLYEPFKFEDVPEMPLTLPPLSEVTFKVIFEPLDIEDYEYELTIKSSDRDEPEVNLYMSGRGIEDYLEVAPEAAISFTGHPGGPFMPSTRIYELTNSGPVNVDWSADPNMSWISVTPVSGSLNPGESTNVTVEWTESARELPVGEHCDILNITNLTTNLNYERTVVMDVFAEAKAWNDPLSFDVLAPYATLTSEFLTIGNSGDAGLQYSLRAVLDNYAPLSELNSSQAVAANEESDIELTAINGSSPYTEGEVLVRFAQINSTDAIESESTWLNNILAEMGGAAVIKEYTLVPGLKLISLPDEITVEQALVAYSALDGVQYVQPNYEVNSNQTFPNDSYFSVLWGMHNTGQSGGTIDADINAPEAWDITTGSGDIIVAVIDTGIDYGHPDLVDNMWRNEPEYNGTPGIDDDGNGYVDDIYGYDFSYDDNDPYDGHFHGTHCAGTIGGTGGNGQGVTGVCWDVKLMAAKFLNDSGNGNDADAIEAIQYAVSMGARIMSCSWGGTSYNQGLKDAIEAAGSAGVVLVAAAGNDGSNNDLLPHYPSSYDCSNIIAVINTDHNDNKAASSCYGLSSVDLGAPGTNIYSCEPGNRYQYLNGTSMATPHVSGACALMLSKNPVLSVPEMKDILIRTVDPTLSNMCVSEGRLNVYEALLEVPDQTGGIGGAWVQFASASGVVGPKDANDIEIIFDAGRKPGIYTGRIIITTNDSYNPEITLPVTFTVEDVDYCTEIFDPNGNDLAYQSFVFKRGSSGAYFNACRTPVDNFPVDPSDGVEIALEDDDYAQVSFDGKIFNFYDNGYGHFYIGSNGYITFASGDFFHAESLEYHYALPRISGLFDDLDPTAGGSISYKQLDDRMVVTFQGIQEFGLPGTNSFQIEMLFNGTIRITFLEISAIDGLVGLSNGNGMSPYFCESNFDQYSTCDFKSDLNNDLQFNFADFSMFSEHWMTQEVPLASVRDEFNTVSYGGNDGSHDWSGNWQEMGESDGPASGTVMILEDGRLRIGRESAIKLPGIALSREVDISTATTAILVFDYDIENYNDKGAVLVQASKDGGVNWDTLGTFLPDAGSGSAQYDFAPYISDSAQIRFLTEESKKFSMYMYIDDIQLQFDNSEVPWYPWCNGSDFDRNFRVDIDDLMLFISDWLQ